MEFDKTMGIAAAGLAAQSTRIRVIAENMANSNSVASQPGGEPYRRQVVMFKNFFDRELEANLVEVDRVLEDRNSSFGRRFDPSHPAADDQGYVLTPNVTGLIEMMDLRQAQRSYEANLKVIESARAMVSRTIELLR